VFPPERTAREGTRYRGPKPSTTEHLDRRGFDGTVQGATTYQTSLTPWPFTSPGALSAAK
jgi:hypothetical protein